MGKRVVRNRTEGKSKKIRSRAGEVKNATQVGILTGLRSFVNDRLR